MGLPCLLVLLVGIYFAYSKFSVYKDSEVVRTTVGDFISGDVVIGAYIDGLYSKTIPSKNDGYIVDKIVCDNNASAEWANDSWGIILTNLTNKTKCNVYFRKYTFADKITDLAKTDTTNIATDDPDKNVRYIGANPNNYVYFNCSDYSNQSDTTCEKWRIIGLFNNISEGNETKENLVKIIGPNKGGYSWDYKTSNVGSSTTDYGSNDWSDSQLMMMLNPTNYLKEGYTNSNDIISSGNQQLYSKMGSYYYGTIGCKSSKITSGSQFNCEKVDFTSTGLKNDLTRNSIQEVVWNLGGINYNYMTANEIYTSERGSNTYSGHAKTWTGKIALMYPSDFVYATSGGTNKSRSECLLLNRLDASSDGCSNNNYFFKLHQTMDWLLGISSDSDSSVTYIDPIGGLTFESPNYPNASLNPTLYLKSSISIKSGSGTSDNPYQLEL